MPWGSCSKGIARSQHHKFLIYSLLHSNNLAYLQLITVLVYGSSPPKSHEKDCVNQTFSKNFEKYVLMNSFLEPVALLRMNFYWGIFPRFCLKISEDFFYRTPACIFVVTVRGFEGLFKKIRNYVDNKIND